MGSESIAHEAFGLMRYLTIILEIEVNILPLFTEIEKNNYFSIYTGSDLNDIFRRKPLKIF